MKNKACFIIAEAGVNHNGILKLAKKLVDAAKKAGADAVKFQAIKPQDMVTESASMAEYQQKNIVKKESQLEMLKRVELKDEDFIELKKYCDSKKIIFLLTPHSESAVDFADKLVPAFKIASGDLTNLPLLEKIAKKNKWIILSTGMGNLNEIEEALKTIRKISKKKITLLHCTTDYPCQLDEVNLRVLPMLREKFGKKFAPLEVGYSDHTKGFEVSVAAVVIGANVLEKHFTLDKNLPGPDHKASLNVEELRDMVNAVKNIEIAMGSAVKKSTKSEEKIKKNVRKSIVAKKDILKGEKIKSDMLIIKRPGTGIEPKHINKIIGKKAKTNIKKDELINWKMV